MVVDATCLERNLILVLQILEMTNKVVVCVNLMDEAKEKILKLLLKNYLKSWAFLLLAQAPEAVRVLKN